MSKAKGKNEQIKRQFFRFLRKAKGCKENTILAKKKALWYFDEFTKDADYKDFNDVLAENFVDYLGKRKGLKDNVLEASTKYDVLRHLRQFFEWLATQQGYRRSINFSDIAFLSLTREESRRALTPKIPDFPDKAYIIDLCKSIKIKTEIDRRDQAIIAFLLLSGMRVKALTTLRIDCFDPSTLRVKQDPARGVETKFSKSNHSRLFEFDKFLVDIIISWYKYLVEYRHYSSCDPLFPRIEVQYNNGYNYSYYAAGLTPEFYKSITSIQSMLKKRSKEAGLKYFSPHAFRHTATSLAVKNIKTGEQLRAVSQMFAHEDIKTTLMNYGRLTSDQAAEIVADMEF